MSRFLEHASQIFETATSAPSGDSSDLTVLIHQGGQIHILCSTESPLDSLQAHHGCRSAFRVTHNVSRTRVEGRQGFKTCLLEENTPRKAAADRLGLFRDQPLYSLASALALA